MKYIFIVWSCIALWSGCSSGFKAPVTQAERANCCANLERNVNVCKKYADQTDDGEMGACESYDREYSDKCGCSLLSR